ncbi:CBL-interacting protein kinase 24 isoform X2 [Cryptomeria japonica]|uniref:CBL-interacting protein kinase 24 isoform X2 n=1 Tax=Cryptomeria japonica TaxID=3369 RepID=UPI0027DA26D8|nr:CBL-interacting protein kinase 24 isoform X2 [Cryptomeria japonica]
MSMIHYINMDRPCLGEFYDDTDSMFEKMKCILNAREKDPEEKFFKQVEAIVVERWNKMITPLHLLAYALTPKYYSNQFLDQPRRLAPWRDLEASDGLKKDAHSWWYFHGTCFQNLQPLAIKVLSQVLSHKGYDGALADLWSCGVILYVLMAGFLPFDEDDLTTLYRKINEAEFSCPTWFSPGAKSLISRILDPDPRMRINVSGIREDDWFKKNYVPVRLYEDDDVNFDDVQAVFDDAEDKYVSEHKETKELGPSMMNAFELITLSQGLNLSALFNRRQDHIRRQTRFISEKPAKVILAKLESAAESMEFKVHICNYKMRIEGLTLNKTGHISVAVEVFEVTPSVFMVEVRKAVGDTLEYHKFYKAFSAKLEDIVWKQIKDSETGL